MIRISTASRFALLTGALLSAGLTGCATSNTATDAVDRGDVTMLRSVLDSGYDVEKTVWNGNFNLMDYAACKGADDALELLLSRGVDVNKGHEPNATFGGYHTPLMRAIQCNGSTTHPTTVRLLLDHGAKVDPTSLALASTNYNDRSITKMVREAADLQAAGKSAAKPAPRQAPGNLDDDAYARMRAAAVPAGIGDFRRVRTLSEDGTLSSILDYARRYPTSRTSQKEEWRTLDLALLTAARVGNLPLVKDLVAAGAAPNSDIIGTAENARQGETVAYLTGLTPGAPRVAAAPPSEPKAVFSDVDAPARRGAERPNDFALVVGIEDYQSVPKADFGVRDAKTVRKHLEALGFPPRNIISLEGSQATGSKLRSYLEEWLPLNVKSESTLFVYYSGHGAPDAKTGDAYLVPWDGDPKFLKSTALPLKQFYADLAKTKAKRVIVALDACFSGAGGRSVLAQGARPLVAKVADLAPAGGKITVLAAASGDEITGTLQEQSHGLFTYHLLKALAANPRASAQALFDDLNPRVQDDARRDNRSQTPVLTGAAPGPLLP